MDHLDWSQESFQTCSTLQKFLLGTNLTSSLTVRLLTSGQASRPKMTGSLPESTKVIRWIRQKPIKDECLPQRFRVILDFGQMIWIFEWCLNRNLLIISFKLEHVIISNMILSERLGWHFETLFRIRPDIEVRSCPMWPTRKIGPFGQFGFEFMYSTLQRFIRLHSRNLMLILYFMAIIWMSGT